MGTYTDLSVAGYPLLESKSGVIPEAMTVFRENDRRIYSRRLGDRNPLVWGNPPPDEADELETATEYACDTAAVMERLGVMGFSLSRARRDFENGRRAEIATYVERTTANAEPPWFADRLALLDSLSFDIYLEGLASVMTSGLTPSPFKAHEATGLSHAVRYILDFNDEFLLGFLADDIRCLIRAACEVAPKPSLVVQDITDLIRAGYYAEDEPVCQHSIESLMAGHLENSNRIVLTEGSTDAFVLNASLRLLYPHLAEYYSFLDFEGARVPGGAGQLASIVKSFAAAGLGNRVIAVFDNDTAAGDARRGLSLVRLPPNIAILSYPDIALLRNYPTLGPGGNTLLNVNGLAASIELYFGDDVLRQRDGSLVPVQWKGLVEPIGRYQGEVLGKSGLQAAFRRKLAAAEADPSVRAKQDWSGMETILQAIFNVFGDAV